VFTLIRNTLDAETVSGQADPNGLKVGLTIGNLPVRGPTTGGDGTGSVLTGGLAGTVNSGAGFSGAVADNAPNFSGTSVGTMRIAVQSRKWPIKTSFYGTDAVQCNRPVWLYEYEATGETCNTGTYVP